MAYDIDTLLALPAKERRKIGEQLLLSVSNKSEIELTVEEENLLNDRWHNHITGKSKSIKSKEMWQTIFNGKPKTVN